MKIQENIPLAPLTTFRVGGPARHFAEARSSEDVRQAVDTARAKNWQLFILGGGSNLVVSDSGFNGLVLKIAIRGIDERTEDGKRVFEAGAGEDWDALVARAVARDLAGIECLSGIPGTVGGTPVQNVGAYGQEVATTIASVRAFDRGSGSVVALAAADCGFGYRMSRFKRQDAGRFVICDVTFGLRKGGEPTTTYPDLVDDLRRSAGAAPTLRDVRASVLRIRRR